MTTTTDQKLTCEEAAKKAQALGFTRVLTAAGWRELEVWAPYGKRAGHRAITFRLETTEGEPVICENAAKESPDFLLGRWHLGR